MEIKIKKVHTGRDLAISAIIVLAGVGICFVHTGLGALVVIWGLISLLLFKQGYKAEGKDTLLGKKSLELSLKCRPSVSAYLEGHDTDPMIVEGHEGGTIQIEVWYNYAEGIAYVRMSDFKDYTFTPATGIIEILPPRSKKLLEKIV